MSIFHKYPYTNMHELNLDWIISMIKELDQEMDEFKVVNEIHFEGEWDIQKAYQRWNLVDVDGFGYIAIKPVPIGVNIDNEDYWRLVANYSAIYADFQNRVIDLENRVTVLESKSPYWVSVKEFGAVGDGVTDDTDAFKAAFADGNKFVVIPVGNYLITDSITVFSNTEVACYGKILDRWDGAGLSENSGLFYGLNESYITIRNLQIECELVSNIPYKNGLYFKECEHVVIDNCSFKNSDYITVVALVTCLYALVTNCYIYNYNRNGICCLNACKHVLIDNDIVVNGSLDAQRYPISLSTYDIVTYPDIPHADDIICSNCYIEDSIATWEGIDAHGGNNLKICNNTIINVRSGISAFTDITKYLYLTNCVIENNYVKLGTSTTSSQSGDNSTIACGGDNLVICGNTLYNGGRLNDSIENDYGFYINYGQNIHVHHNNIVDSNGILFLLVGGTAGLNNVLIEDNIVDNLERVTPTGGISTVLLHVHNALLYKNVIFRNNIISNTSSDMWLLYGRTTYTADTYIKFIDNELINCTGTVIIGSQATGCVVSPYTAKPTMMGYKGDIVRNSNIVSGQTLGWICSVSQSGNTPATWINLPNL